MTSGFELMSMWDVNSAALPSMLGVPAMFRLPSSRIHYALTVSAVLSPAAQARKVPCRSFYLDLTLVEDY